MLVELAAASYRLLFHTPFGTGHGFRDGTESLFVRLRLGDTYGYGEATLPPYVNDSVARARAGLEKVDQRVLDKVVQEARFDQLRELTVEGSPGARNALVCAILDLIGRRTGQTLGQLLKVTGGDSDPLMMMTLGVSSIQDIEHKLSQLPDVEILKVKIDSCDYLSQLVWSKKLINRRLFLDMNAAFDGPEMILDMLNELSGHNVVGIEQPFGSDQDGLHKELTRRTRLPVFADESIQGLSDLEQRAHCFSGVNIKLMKCGGPDIADAMARRAKELGLMVMLGSMSESSLGCTAMGHLSAHARWVDLDGPWLLRNDPFKGLGVRAGRLAMPRLPGVGADITGPLEFDVIGA
jgi:L-Ala-D/L-Glu epimerase